MYVFLAGYQIHCILHYCNDVARRKRPVCIVCVKEMFHVVLFPLICSIWLCLPYFYIFITLAGISPPGMYLFTRGALTLGFPHVRRQVRHISSISGRVIVDAKPMNSERKLVFFQHSNILQNACGKFLGRNLSNAFCLRCICLFLKNSTGSPGRNLSTSPTYLSIYSFENLSAHYFHTFFLVLGTADFSFWTEKALIFARHCENSKHCISFNLASIKWWRMFLFQVLRLIHRFST